MKRWYKYIFICCLGVAAVFSCEKQPVEDPALSEQLILLDTAPGANDTKGFLNSGGLAVDGTQFQTYDYLSGYRGTVLGHTGGEEFEYFSNTVTYKSDATDWKWLFGDVSSPTTYRWTRTGTHHFFGWLMADGNDANNLNTGSFFDTYTPPTNNNKKAILAKNLTVDDLQYDFLYSGVDSVDVTTNGAPAKVDMPMKHLFGALGVSISNNSDLDVIVYGVSFQNFPNSNSVTLDYSNFAAEDVLSYNQPTSVTPVYFSNKFPNGTSITLYNRNSSNGAKVYDAITREDITDSNPSYHMAWPVLRSVLEPTSISYDGEGNPVYASNAPLILVDCKVGTQDRKTLKLKFPTNSETPWFITAGKKTHLMLQFLNKQIGLSFTIKDWQFEKYPMSYEDDAISATQLKFTLNTYTGGETERINGVKHTVIKLTASSTAGSYIATGSFKVFTPINGTLTVGLGGNADDFVATLQSGDATYGGTESITINPNRDGGKITLSIRPVGTPAHGSRCFLHFGVRNNGRDSEADSEINRDAYIVEFP